MSRSITLSSVAAIDGTPLRRHERKLFDRVVAVLPEGESLLAAALVFTGPEPNLVGLVEDALGQRGMLAYRRRKYLTLILTDRRVILTDNVGENTPAHLHGQYTGTSALRGASTRDGDTWVDVEETRYWFWPEWKAQISAMLRIAEQP
jgi:hypothetical protein